MSRVTLCTYDPHHIYEGVTFPNFSYSMDDCKKLFVSKNMVTFSIFKDEKLIAVVPNFYIRPYVVETMLYVTAEAKKYSLSLYKGLKLLLDNGAELLGAKRVQACVEVGNKQALKLDLSLGFEYECVLKRYSDDDKDCYLLARFY